MFMCIFKAQGGDFHDVFVKSANKGGEEGLEGRKEGGEERREDGGKMEGRRERMKLPVSAESVFLSHPAGCAEADW